MSLWGIQKTAFETFISNLEKLIKQWAKGDYYPFQRRILTKLEKSSELLLKANENLNLTDQNNVVKEIMVFLAKNMSKNFSTENKIMELKNKLKQNQDSIAS